MQNEDSLKPGSRIRLTPLGIARCPKLGKRVTGVVIGPTPTKARFIVRLDGTKGLRNFHRSYIMPIIGEEGATPVSDDRSSSR